jgi:hypothetical protein
MMTNRTPTAPTGATFLGHRIEANAPDLKVIHGFMLGHEHAGLVTISTHEGRTALDVRRFFLDEHTKTWRPSVKGLRIPREQIEQIAEALNLYLVRNKV